MLCPPFPVVHTHLLCLDQVEGEIAVLAPLGQVFDLLHIGCLIVVGDQAYLPLLCLNDGVGIVPGRAVMSEQGVLERTGHTPLRGPRVEDQHGGCVVTYPYHLKRSVRKSRIQLQREVFSPRVLSLVMSFESTMVLNTEL